MDQPTAIKAIRRKSLHEELAESLEELIVTGHLKPGTKVPERALCEQFNVSRTPLREALKVLANREFVVLEPNRGAWVSEITVEDLDDVFPVMGALESLAGELAAQRITDAEVAEIRRLHDEMQQHYRNRDLPAYFSCNEAIHDAILAAARNATLTSQHKALAARVRRARYVANMTPHRWQKAMDEHEQMMRHLSARDSAGLSQVLRDHLKNKLETVKEWIARGPDDR